MESYFARCLAREISYFRVKPFEVRLNPRLAARAPPPTVQETVPHEFVCLELEVPCSQRVRKCRFAPATPE